MISDCVKRIKIINICIISDYSKSVQKLNYANLIRYVFYISCNFN